MSSSAGLYGVSAACSHSMSGLCSQRRLQRLLLLAGGKKPKSLGRLPKSECSLGSRPMDRTALNLPFQRVLGSGVECPPVCGHSHLRIKNCRQLSPTKEDAFLLGTSRKVVGSQGSFGRKAVWNTRMHPLECFWVLFLSRIPELRAAQRAGLGSFEDSFQRI